MKSVHLNSSIYSFVQTNGDALAKCFVNFVIRIQHRKVPNFELLHNRSLHGSIPMFYEIIFLFLRAFITFWSFLLFWFPTWKDFKNKQQDAQQSSSKNATERISFSYWDSSRKK